jgi:hypothetical protein
MAIVSPRLLLLAALVVLAGCDAEATKPSPPPSSAEATVALLQAPKRPGEVVIRGDLSPASHGPYAFDGRYVARFEQFAPENPNVDFTGQTAFVVTLDRRAQEEHAGSIKVFRSAQRTGRKVLTVHGRYHVDVTFGDFPYAIRFTPVR